MRFLIGFAVAVILTTGCARPLGWYFPDERDAGVSVDSGGICGNGIVDPGEECDDGNTVSGDGCDASCRVDACTPEPEVCNGLDDNCNGLVDEGGVCDCDDPLALQVVHREDLPGPGDAADPTIVWTGTEYGSAWSGGFARLGPGGHLLESHASSGFMGSESADTVYLAGPDRYVFCWSSMEDVYCGIKIPGSSAVERVLAVDGQSSGTAYNNPRAAVSDVSDRIAIAHPVGAYGSQQFEAAILDGSLSPVVTNLPINDHLGMGIWYTALTWADDHFVFAYVGSDGLLYLSRFSDRGERMIPDVLVASLPGLEYLGETMPWDGETFRLAWSDFYQIHYLRFSPTGEIATSRQITDYQDGTLVYVPVLALGQWTGLVWNDLAGPGWDTGPANVWFLALDDDGEPLSDQINLSDQAIYPWIATDGETFLVGWREGDIWDPEIAFAHLGCP